MPALPLRSAFPQQQQQQHLNLNGFPHRRRPLLEQMHFMISDSSTQATVDNHHHSHSPPPVKPEREQLSTNGIRGDGSGGEEKDFGDKWEPIKDDADKVYTNHLEEPETTQTSHLHSLQQQQHHPHQSLHQVNSIVNTHAQTVQHSSPPPFQQIFQPQQQQQPHQVTDEVSLDSQDNLEGSILPSSGSSTGCASTTACPQSSTKENTSFLFVGPLGKKRKYSRQRATSDDNESESHPPTAAGSPETPEEEMDQSQSPSPGENSQPLPPHRKTSPVLQEHSSGGEPVSTIVSPSTQRSTTSPESGGESTSESTAGGGGTGITVATSDGSGSTAGQGIISKPSPMIGAPTSVIRRVNRKKQENPLPLNLSVSSPPGNSNSNFSNSSGSSTPHLVSTGSPGTSGSSRASTLVRGDGLGQCPTTNPSVIREELYFDGRSSGQGDRQVFIWRYRDDVTGAPTTTTLSSAAAGSMSPSLSTTSSASFIVPDVIGTKGMGSSGTGSSASSTISALHAGSHDPNHQSQDSKSAGSTSGKPPKKKLKCGDCGKEFSQLRNYRYHRSRHEGSDQFSCTCPVCGKQFNDRGYLSSHMKIHRNAKEYRCEYCTKGFNQRVAYNMHRRIHTGHRPHQCEVCSKSFSRRMLLKQHMRIHTGERPYSCGVCNKAFADRSNMLLHQRLHSGERPYVCEICKKSFSKNHHLKTHMNHHAGIKPYECPKCHARFSQSSNMKTHLKKCSGVPNPTTTQRQQMLRRNPLDMGRPGGQLLSLPSLPGVIATSRAGEQLPSLPGASRLLYDHQSLSLLTQTMTGGQGGVGVGGQIPTIPQLSPGHSRGQVPIESLLLSLNVGRTRHPSQGSGHQPLSPNSSMSIPDLQIMLRNAAAAAAVSSSTGSRSASSTHGQRASYSSPPPPPQGVSSAAPSATAVTMAGIPGMASFGGLAFNQPKRSSPPEHGGNMGGGGENVSPPSLSPIMSINPSLGLVGYGRNTGHIDSSAMPPPSSNGTVLRNISSHQQQQQLIPPELLSPAAENILRIDTRGMEGFHQGNVSPPEKMISSGGRQGRVVPSPLVSPRRKPPSPSSLSAGGSFIPLSTLESAAIASGLRSPSQVVRFLSSALRDAESPIQQSNQPSAYTRLPSLSHQNVIEAMVAAAASSSQHQTGRQVPSPQSHPHHQPNHLQPGAFQFSGELPNLHGMGQGQGGVLVSAPSGGSSHHSIISPQTQSPHPTHTVITSSHLLQHHQEHQQQQQLNIQQQQSGLNNVRYSSNSPNTSSVTESASHPAADQPQQIELHQHRQHGYHMALLSHVQGTVSQQSSGYSSNPSNNNNNNSPSSSSSTYTAFTHSIIRSRSPSSLEHLRERNPEYQN